MSDIPRRTRYEVLRRDNYTCRYCGAKAPDVKLNVDAVVPDVLGGSHKDPANLVTACEACNGGKSSSAPDAPLVAEVNERALEWAQAMRSAQTKMLADLGARAKDRAEFEQYWDSWGRGEGDKRVRFPKDGTWWITVDQIMSAGLPMAVLKHCVDLAMAKRTVKEGNKFRYMCGIAWHMIRDLNESASALGAGQGSGTPEDDEELDPAIKRGRADLARELLGDLGEDDVERLLAEAREDWQAETEDDQHIAAAHIAWQEERIGLSWLASSVCELLPLIQDEIIEKAMRQVRIDLYDEHGPGFSRARFANDAVDCATRLYDEKHAAEYLAALPDDERAEWVAYAQANCRDGRTLSGRWAVVNPARIAKAIKAGYGAYPGMCIVKGEHIPFCPNRATHHLRFNELDCCQEPPEEHKGHPLCARHTERALAGGQGRNGELLTVMSSEPVIEDETAVPF